MSLAEYEPPLHQRRTEGEKLRKARDLAMTLEEALDLALESSEPLQEVRSLAEQLARDGFSKAAVVEQFEQSRQSLRAQGKDREEDLLLEVMDFIEGWCCPHMKIGGEAANPARSI